VCQTSQFLLTGPDKLGFTDSAVTLRAHGVHTVRVELTTASISEETRGVCCPALSHSAGLVHSRGYVVVGVVGGQPVENDHVRGAVM